MTDEMNETYSDDNEELVQVAMQILIHAGDARNHLVAALQAVASQDYQAAESSLKVANEEIVIAHGLQTETLQKEASGEYIRYSTLFAHAQDTMMTAKSEILIGEQLINIFKSLKAEEEIR